MTLPVYGEQHKIDLAFNGDGLLETAAISDESRAAAVLAAVKRAPAQVAAGANAATKVAGALVHEDYAKNRQIAELQLRQQQLTLQVADGTLESDAATAAEREKVANLLAELQNQQKIDALYGVPCGPGPAPEGWVSSPEGAGYSAHSRIGHFGGSERAWAAPSSTHLSSSDSDANCDESMRSQPFIFRPRISIGSAAVAAMSSSPSAGSTWTRAPP